MAKKQTKSQKCKDLFDAFKCLQGGEKPRRSGTKDGSIPTHPIVEVDKTKTEATVLIDCMIWLKEHDVLCNRNNVGAGQMGTSGYYSYGIKNAGDIHGVLRNHNGRHLEIEVKRGKGGRLSLGQQKRMKEMQENNGIYLIVHGVEELEYYMIKKIKFGEYK